MFPQRMVWILPKSPEIHEGASSLLGGNDERVFNPFMRIDPLRGVPLKGTMFRMVRIIFDHGMHICVIVGLAELG